MEFAPDIYPFVYSAYSATSSLYWEFLLSACQSSSSVFASSSGLWFGLLLGLALVGIHTLSPVFKTGRVLAP